MIVFDWVPEWVRDRMMVNVDFSKDKEGNATPDEEYASRHELINDIHRADCITSRHKGNANNHKPILDIDFELWTVESSTPGHYHLYLDKELTWKKYRHLLNALADVGIIEEGYKKASLERGYTSVRLPWRKK